MKQEFNAHKEVEELIKTVDSRIDGLEKDRDRSFVYISDAERHISETKKDLCDYKTENLNTIKDTNKRMEKLEEKVENIETKTTKISTDVDWLKKFFWIVATASIGSLVTGLYSLLLTK